jgi:alpha-ketoglutarate-dependent taurine dioxygenase
MLIWDNRSAMHQGVIDCPPEETRLMYRVIVKGEKPR